MAYRDDYIKNIPGRIKALRKAAGLTQEQFAAAADMSLCSIRKYEQGKSIPDLYALCKICDFFKCDMDYLSGKYDAHERSTQEIMNRIGLSEDAVDKLSMLTLATKSDNSQQLLENDFFANYLQTIGYLKITDDGSKNVDYMFVGYVLDLLEDLSTMLTNGLMEAIENYVMWTREKTENFLDTYQNEMHLYEIRKILKSMQIEL